jgi:ribulose-5-phosphate 4-epimerase/fuculose-1-phosphate aldolase
MAWAGMSEMISNHVTARVPGAAGEFLINPYGLLYNEMTASCMIKLDLDGNVLFNATEYSHSPAGYVIH